MVMGLFQSSSEEEKEKAPRCKIDVLRRIRKETRKRAKKCESKFLLERIRKKRLFS